jgi:hypothetical protein
MLAELDPMILDLNQNLLRHLGTAGLKQLLELIEQARIQTERLRD